MGASIWGASLREEQEFPDRAEAIAAVRERRLSLAFHLVTWEVLKRQRGHLGATSRETRWRFEFFFHRDQYAYACLFAWMAGGSVVREEHDVLRVDYSEPRCHLDDLLEDCGGFAPTACVFEGDDPSSAREAVCRREVDLAIQPTEMWFDEDGFGREPGVRPV